MTEAELENLAALFAARDRLRAALLSNFDADPARLARCLLAVLADIDNRTRRVTRRGSH